MHCLEQFVILMLLKVIQDRWYSDLLEKVSEHPHKYPEFKVKNNKLYKLVNAGIQQYDSEYDWKLVIPKKLREAVLLENHDEAT